MAKKTDSELSTQVRGALKQPPKKTDSELSTQVRGALKQPPKATPNQNLSKTEREFLEKLRIREVGSAWWQPQEDGDYVVGLVADQREADSQFKEGKKPKKQTVVTLDRGDLGAIQVSINVVLANDFKRLAPRDGDKIMIVYRGLAQSARRGKPARLYTMDVLERVKTA